MKKILFMLLINACAFSQNTEFSMTKENGFTDYVVTIIPNKTQAELYKKTLDWIKVTYNRPDVVLLSQIENDYIRFEGIDDDIIITNYLGKHYFKCKYQIEISFKDGKYKFDVIDMQALDNGTWHKYDLDTFDQFFKSNGEPKNAFKYSQVSIPKAFNDLNLSLKEFILSETIPSKKNDW